MIYGLRKTEVSKKLSTILDLPLVELDNLTLNFLVEKYFRNFKLDGVVNFAILKACAESIEDENAIISMGGGSDLELISGKIIYLKTSFELIAERLKDKIDRPLLTMRWKII